MKEEANTEMSQFKDGDVLVREENIITQCAKCILIYKASHNADNKVASYAFYNDFCKNLYLGLSVDNGEIRIATDSEKQQLFDALAKKGKKWDDDKKQIVDSYENYEFNTFDYILMKVKGFNGKWLLGQFAFIKDNDLYIIGGFVYDMDEVITLPYNDKTKHLLGTTDDWK